MCSKDNVFFLLRTYVYCCCFCASACFAKSYTSYTVHVHSFHSMKPCGQHAGELGILPRESLDFTAVENDWGRIKSFNISLF